MNGITTITSKRQLTIPVHLFKEVGFQEGQKVFIKKYKNGVNIEMAYALIERLAGSVKVPKRFKGMQPDEIIIKAKDEYFSKRKK